MIERPTVVIMSRPVFRRLVASAWASLPDPFRKRLNNVEILVQDWPDDETLRLAGVTSPAGLLGFYHGVPLTERTTNYSQVLPDRISIYRRPILLACDSRQQVGPMVTRVLRHEIGHHFGIGDERLRDLGAY